MQLGLFESGGAASAAVYPNHPGHAATDTSIDAATEVASVAGTLRANVMRVLGEEPLTVHEAAERLDLSVPSVQPRFSELKRMGKIEDSGKRRVNEVSGKKAIVWKVRQ